MLELHILETYFYKCKVKNCINIIYVLSDQRYFGMLDRINHQVSIPTIEELSLFIPESLQWKQMTTEDMILLHPFPDQVSSQYQIDRVTLVLHQNQMLQSIRCCI